MDFKILDDMFDAEEAVEYLKKDKSDYSKLFRDGYVLKCWVLFKAPSKRRVGGLEEIELELKNNTISVSYPPKYSYFAGLILGIEFCYYYGAIKNIKLDNEIKEQITWEDLPKHNKIEINFDTDKNAISANSSVYYIISPYKNDNYYIDKEMESWRS